MQLGRLYGGRHLRTTLVLAGTSATAGALTGVVGLGLATPTAHGDQVPQQQSGTTQPTATPKHHHASPHLRSTPQQTQVRTWASPTASTSPTPTKSATPTASATHSPTATATATPSESPTASSTPTATSTSTATAPAAATSPQTTAATAPTSPTGDSQI